MNMTDAAVSAGSETPDKVTISTLKDEVELLKVENSSLQARLLDMSIVTQKYANEIKSLQDTINEMKKPPLFIASVMEVDGNTAMLMQHGNNQEFMTEVNSELMPDIREGSRVAVNRDLSIIKALGKSSDVRARVMELTELPDVSFDDVGGLDDAVLEIRETVEYPMTQPELYKKIGVEPPKGVLLYGVPGTGKTLLAKAVANSVGATFIKMSGSELIHKFIGEGARLVRDIFQMAREKAPTVLFIDEIDSVGARRTFDGTVGSSEVNRTMTQLLTELDGFDNRGNVRIIAATNRIDILDPALLRAGRFDRIIEVPAPDENSRLSILKIHTKDMALDKSVNIEKIAKNVDGATGATLKSISTEAGMMAIRRKSDAVTMDDFEEAVKKVMIAKVEEQTRMFG